VHRAPGIPCALSLQGQDEKDTSRKKACGEIAKPWLFAAGCLKIDS
jgi:hypothetical protein